MSEVNHMVMCLFFCKVHVHIFWVFILTYSILIYMNDLYKLKNCDCVANILSVGFFVLVWFGLVFVFRLNYFNHVTLEILDFRLCVLLKNAFPGPKLQIFISIVKS